MRNRTQLRFTTARALCEALEGRTLLSSVHFAAIGDYGSGFTNEKDVANLVKSWNPQFIITLGDNNYPLGAASTIDPVIGKYYGDYIYPYKGLYGAGAADHVNHFFPVLGNHDWATASAQPYFDYFTLPGNERYYTFTQGPVQFFALDSDPHDRDLNLTSLTQPDTNSVEAQWLKNALAASTAAWKIVYFHHPPYSSGSAHGSSPWMQWPFAQWGASAVLSGHEHQYERIVLGGLPYFVNGLGGGTHYPEFVTPVQGSQVRYSDNYGAMLIDASNTALTFQFITRAGRIIDTYTLGKTPAAPSQLAAAGVSPGNISVTWTDNATDETSFILERSANGTTYLPIASLAANADSFLDSFLAAGARYYYRLKASNAAGDSSYAQLATPASTFPANSLPNAWISAGIGPQPFGGSVKMTASQYTVRGSGWAFAGTSDSGHLLARSIASNGRITAHLDSMQNTSPAAQAGLMIRQDLNPASPYVGLFFTPSHTVILQTRSVTGGTTKTKTLAALGDGQYRWLRLLHSGNAFSGYASADGLHWTAIGWSLVDMTGPIYIGLADSSNNRLAANSGVFSSISIA